MHQILQDLKTGETLLAQVPAPKVKPGHLLIQNQYSAVSSGTEKMLLDFGNANWVQKAKQQPDKVKMVLNKIKTDGLKPTYNSVMNKLEQPLPLGYSCAGTVIAVGEGVTNFKPGDLVISNGPHAEVVCIPQNLCAKVPEGVSLQEASFTVIGAIALQGIRLASPVIGDNVVVVGLGLIGLITVQILKSQGCNVLGFDFDNKKCELARSFGAESYCISDGLDPVSVAMKFSNNNGVDCVLITASTPSNEPMHQAASMCRKRGKIVLVGVVGLELSRADFYEKELTFQVSASYGPGRYDVNYEEKSQDYPYGFVRWTAQRNFEAILNLLKNNSISFNKLISETSDMESALDIYHKIANKIPVLGATIKYPEIESSLRTSISINSNTEIKHAEKDEVIIGVIGAGNFSKAQLVPAIKKTSAKLETIVSSRGVSGTHLAKKFKFNRSSTDIKDVLDNDKVNTVVISTPHNTHGSMANMALKRGKAVFVEKPLCMNRAELEQIKETALKAENKIQLMVGFNRRFSPLVKKMKKLLSSEHGVKCISININSGYIPSDHWTQDVTIGGGRIVGEACHFIDLARFLVGSEITDVKACSIGENSKEDVLSDKASINLSFKDGSLAVINYFSNGHKSYPKEKIEVYTGGKILFLNNFKKLIGYGFKGFKKMSLFNQDKGHNNCMLEFINNIKKGEQAPIPLNELLEVTEATLLADELIKSSFKKNDTSIDVNVSSSLDITT